MDTIANFLVDPLVWPLYCYLAGYVGVWIVAFGLSRLWSDEKIYGSYDTAAHKAWTLAIICHLAIGALLIIYLTFKATSIFESWWQIPLYMLLYIILIVLDIFLLLLLAKQNPKGRKEGTQTKNIQRRETQ